MSERELVIRMLEDSGYYFVPVEVKRKRKTEIETGIEKENAK